MADKRSLARVVAALTFAVMVLGACGGGSSSDDAGRAETQAEAAVAEVGQGAAEQAGGSQDSPAFDGQGQGIVRFADREWIITGQCTTSGQDITFSGNDGAILSVGIKVDGAPAVGSFSAPADGAALLIGGSSQQPDPTVVVNDDGFSLSGEFGFGGAESVEATIDVTCG